MGSVCVRKAGRQRTMLAAVALSAVLCGSVSACEYTYDEVRGPVPTVPTPTFTDPTLPRDPNRNRPVTGDELKAWTEEVLPSIQGQTFYTASGLLTSGESRTDQTVQLPAGSYAVTLACRSTRRVAFTVQNGENVLVDLMVQCGTARVNVVQLTTDAILKVTSRATNTANYAFRVSRL